MSYKAIICRPHASMYRFQMQDFSIFQSLHKRIARPWSSPIQSTRGQALLAMPFLINVRDTKICNRNFFPDCINISQTTRREAKNCLGSLHCLRPKWANAGHAVNSLRKQAQRYCTICVARSFPSSIAFPSKSPLPLRNSSALRGRRGKRWRVGVRDGETVIEMEGWKLRRREGKNGRETRGVLGISRGTLAGEQWHGDEINKQRRESTPGWGQGPTGDIEGETLDLGIGVWLSEDSWKTHPLGMGMV